jgi:hypothetical protein
MQAVLGPRLNPSRHALVDDQGDVLRACHAAPCFMLKTFSHGDTFVTVRMNTSLQ